MLSIYVPEAGYLIKYRPQTKKLYAPDLHRYCELKNYCDSFNFQLGLIKK